jgi:hypothetical protein
MKWVVWIALVGFALAAEQPWQHGTITAISRVSLPDPPGSDQPGIEYTIQADGISFVAIELASTLHAPVPRFQTGDSISFQKRNARTLRFLDPSGKQHDLKLIRQTER